MSVQPGVKEAQTDAALRMAVRFGREVSVAQLSTVMFNEFGVVLTHEDVKRICARMGFFVTTVAKRSRTVEVVRWTERSSRRRKPSMFSGLDISGAVNAMLDQVMEPGEIRPTRDVYALLKQRHSDMKDVSSSKLTRSLDPSRYRVTVRTIKQVTMRYIERLTDDAPDRLVKVGGTTMVKPASFDVGNSLNATQPASV